MYYISQLISILIAASMAEHDAPAVNHFGFYGVTPEIQKQFHSANTFSKAAIVIGFSLLILFNPHATLFNYFFDAVIAGFTNWLWFFLVFDPILNKARKNGLSWDYISSNDETGKWLLKHLGKNAGQLKAIICVILIAILNILYIWL